MDYDDDEDLTKTVMSRYLLVVGVRGIPFLLVLGFCPTECVVGLRWAEGTGEICVGPFTIGFRRD